VHELSASYMSGGLSMSLSRLRLLTFALRAYWSQRYLFALGRGEHTDECPECAYNPKRKEGGSALVPQHGVRDPPAATGTRSSTPSPTTRWPSS